MEDDPVMMLDDHHDDGHHHHHHDVEGLDVEPIHVVDLFDREPTKEEIWEMKRAAKRPSEWLKLLCKDWAEENLALVDATDEKFLAYKPYLKGLISSQLLCRLCIPSSSSTTGSSTAKSQSKNESINDTAENTSPTNQSSASSSSPFDFWQMLNIRDEFDKAYIIAQVERFCTLYNIRGGIDVPPALAAGSSIPAAASMAATAAAAAAAAASNGTLLPSHFLTPDATAAAVAAAQAAELQKLSKDQLTGSNRNATTTTADAVTKAERMARDAEKALEQERKSTAKREQKRQSQERKMEKQREREQIQIQKAAEKIAREVSREEKRRKKLELRTQRERFIQEQKEAALKRAAELVESNRVPIEITRGAAAAKAAAQQALQQMGTVATPATTPAPPVATVSTGPDAARTDAASSPQQEQPHAPLSGPKKPRSAIVVSTATDLHQIVTHSKNLWAKYNAIAKEHNQKVNWITVAKELGIHVKVREKYARMHFRAEQRGFDWVKNGHWKIKDHPEIFVQPTAAERMPPPPPESERVLISDLGHTTGGHSHGPSSTNTDSKTDGVAADSEANTAIATDEAAVAAAAAVVDAAGVGSHMTTTMTTNAAVAATYVADPTSTNDSNGEGDSGHGNPMVGSRDIAI